MATTAERVKRVDDEVRGVAAQFDLSSKDLDFLRNIASWQRPLSAGQEKWLVDIERKVFPDEHDED